MLHASRLAYRPLLFARLLKLSSSSGGRNRPWPLQSVLVRCCWARSLPCATIFAHRRRRSWHDAPGPIRRHCPVLQSETRVWLATRHNLKHLLGAQRLWRL